MTGLHIVKKPRFGKPDRYYVYAWRGGPRIHTQDGEYPVIDRKLLGKQHTEINKSRKGLNGETFESLISDYRNSPEYTNLRDSTRDDYRIWLDRISERFGAVPVMAFDDSRMRADVVSFRDEWKDKPRSADKAVQMLSTVIDFGVQRSRLNINVAKKIRKLHKVNKADMIWEDHHWKAFLEQDPAPAEHLIEGLEFDQLTGLRLGDLVNVRWEDVGLNAIIVKETQKKRSRAVIPITRDLRIFLDKIAAKRPKEGAILRNSRGYPWTASGFGTVFQRSKPPGFDRTIHDLRGTYATKLIIAGLSDNEVAMILGWTAKRVSDVRQRYVNEERVILALAEKIDRKAS